ncbi:MAG: ATP-binding protein [Bacteroidetes bacterium]|nr:ATP-binding protein [Bacteroidota bacterium]
MRRKWITTLIILGSLALSGIILVQLLWIRNAITVSQDKFDRNVSEALGKVADKLEKKEDVALINTKMDLRLDTIIEPPCPPQPKILVKKKHRQNTIITLTGDTIYSSSPLKDFCITIDSVLSGSSFEYNLSGNFFENNMNGAFVFPSTPGSTDLDSLKGWVDGYKYTLPMPKRPKNLLFSYYNSASSPWPVLTEFPVHERTDKIRTEKDELKQEVDKLNNKVRKIKDVVHQLVVEVDTRDEKVENRIDSSILVEELDKTFSDLGIKLPYEYAIVHTGNDSLSQLHSLNFNPLKIGEAYQTTLFPGDLFSKDNHLVVYFPGKNMHIYKSLSILMAVSLLFTIILLFTVLATLVTIIRQKKISEIKNDFINNMTHEFKTPIATISLATDSINNSRVINDPDSIRNFTRVIREENDRMNSHVEQVLQMAMLDRQEIKLNTQEIDLHELISRTVESILLQVDNKGGSVQLELYAEKSMVKGDDIHLFNAIMNLLDNANKYTPQTPDIKVITQNEGDWFILKVTDNGIGMSRETQRRIFEKFYRVHTGNIHTVKGFGLGLSYVKAITEAHHGKISVTSEPGTGSTFEIRLPLA